MDNKTRLGSVLAALGVIASLGLVAYELRQNTQAVVGQTLQALATEHAELARDGVESVELRRAFSLANDDLSALTEDDRSLLSWFYAAVMRVTENRFRQYQLGTIDADALMHMGASGPLFRNAYFKDWWPTRRGYHPQDFMMWVDSALMPLERYAANP
jgi:hypothetical protein